MNVPFIDLCQVAVGASFALMSWNAPLPPVSRAVPWLALNAYQVLMVVPLTGLLLWLYPAWSMNYWFDAPSPFWAFAGVPMAWLGFATCRGLQQMKKQSLAWGLCTASLLAAAALCYGTRLRWLWVGSAAAFHEGVVARLKPLEQSDAASFLRLSLPLALALWAFHMWRLHLAYTAGRPRKK